MTLRERLNRAETAEEAAEICAISAILENSPMWCPACGKQIYGAERVPPIHATVDMASAAADKFGIPLSQAASIYRTMVEVR